MRSVIQNPLTIWAGFAKLALLHDEVDISCEAVSSTKLLPVCLFPSVRVLRAARARRPTMSNNNRKQKPKRKENGTLWAGDVTRTVENT